MLQEVPAILRVKDAMDLLHIKDARTFDSWCVKHQVTIFNDVGGRFVYGEEFSFKIMKPIIEEMKKKYPNWREKFFTEELMQESQPTKPVSDIKRPLKYVPQGKNENNYLKKLIERATNKTK